MRRSLQRKILWRVVGAGSALLAAQVMRALLDRGYQSVRGSEPPTRPWMKGTRMRNALLWTATTAVAVSVAEILAEYAASNAWKQKTGKRPPV